MFRVSDLRRFALDSLHSKRHFAPVAAGLLAAELVFGMLIIRRVPCA